MSSVCLFSLDHVFPSLVDHFLVSLSSLSLRTEDTASSSFWILVLCAPLHPHKDLQRTRIQKDEEAVSSVLTLLKSWTNPFSENKELVCISTAKTVPKDIVADLLNANEVGELNYAAFKKERLENDPPVNKHGVIL
jgi:hypothetical protein